MNIINGNYGNNTIAVMQWAHERGLEDVTVVSVDTGWAAEGWELRVKQAEDYALKKGFSVVRLKSESSFQSLMRDRKEFPSQKFQWCAGFLKGLPLLDWLDEVDPSCEATIIMGKRKVDSRINFDLEEIIAESEHYGERKVWYPLVDCNDEEFNNLIARSGIERLKQRSLECDPCVKSDNIDLTRLPNSTIEKVAKLERALNKTMFDRPIEEMVKLAKESTKAGREYTTEMFDMGCGSPFGCGE